MKRSNLIPITRIYDIYPKYTFSVDVKRFMDEIVDIDRANVYTKEEVIAMLKELQLRINTIAYHWDNGVHICYIIIQQKINALKKDEENE